ncbi:MAG: 2Fe-2S iron-sulfur cluster binding domain-containing protein [candidate division Zixibacteria bacterium]|nr:2Fe-2S iron-sulfur cluster binding domain-containing protein [candidate division Zixibacteria bacterium]
METILNTNVEIKVGFKLNGLLYEKSIPANWTLLQLLRDGLGYYGTKCGCEIGECGACTVLLNGQAINSCLVLAPQIEGAEIWTIEGVADSINSLHPVQRIFIEYDAVHCGFCTPGMIMSTIALLLENSSPDENTIKTALAGNLCRCTGYVQIIEAVKKLSGIITEKDLEKFRYSE